jgi:hypothetical protein
VWRLAQRRRPSPIRALSLRAGVDLGQSPTRATIDTFLDRQRFIPANDEGLHLVRKRMTERNYCLPEDTPTSS